MTIKVDRNSKSQNTGIPQSDNFIIFRHILPFEAFFTSNSDPEFTVIPSSGELLPYGTEGTLIKIGYKPTLYGKTHRAKLIIQVSC